ncbi:MAG TPA: flagellar motor protein [Chloroflexota bacterium]|jgi:chemotaxis protein MotA|nr:flagellar motor protein [Chloroflexota bacterium]
MDMSTIIGLVLAVLALLIPMVFGDALSGIQFGQYITAEPIIIIGFGTIGAGFIANRMENMQALVKTFRKAISKGEAANGELIGRIVALAEKARREGLLSLEEEIAGINDPFLAKGMQLVIDGTDPELVRQVLEIDLSLMEKRHEDGFGTWESMGGFAPTFGIMGTVLGLVKVLSNLADPSSLGPAIATAFLATFYGISSANVFWLPVGAKLRKKSEEEVLFRQVMLDGILSIQAGDNPRIIQEKLEGFLSPSERAAAEAVITAAAGAAQAA